MKVINLFAGPGAGKSTTAAGLFHLMKTEGYSVELVTEYAKDKVYEGHLGCLEDQIYIFGKQQRRLNRLRGHVDFAITDSPILLSLLYSKVQSKYFESLVYEVFETYDNYNFFIKRDKPYVKVGRTQTENEAKELDTILRELMSRWNVPFTEITGNKQCVESIWREINV